MTISVRLCSIQSGGRISAKLPKQLATATPFSSISYGLANLTISVRLTSSKAIILVLENDMQVFQDN